MKIEKVARFGGEALLLIVILGVALRYGGAIIGDSPRVTLPTASASTPAIDESVSSATPLAAQPAPNQSVLAAQWEAQKMAANQHAPSGYTYAPTQAQEGVDSRGVLVLTKTDAYNLCQITSRYALSAALGSQSGVAESSIDNAISAGQQALVTQKGFSEALATALTNGYKAVTAAAYTSNMAPADFALKAQKQCNANPGYFFHD